MEALPRAQVLDFLLKSRPSAAIPYLKHVVGAWKDPNPLFHSALALEYKDYILSLREKGLETPEVPDKGGRVFKATAEEAREELRTMLRSDESRHDAALLEERFPRQGMEQERALLLGSLGRHREAIALLLYGLKDVKGTVEYCHHHANKEGGQAVFSLVRKLRHWP